TILVILSSLYHHKRRQYIRFVTYQRTNYGIDMAKISPGDTFEPTNIVWVDTKGRLSIYQSTTSLIPHPMVDSVMDHLINIDPLSQIYLMQIQISVNLWRYSLITSNY